MVVPSLADNRAIGFLFFFSLHATTYCSSCAVCSTYMPGEVTITFNVLHNPITTKVKRYNHLFATPTEDHALNPVNFLCSVVAVSASS